MKALGKVGNSYSSRDDSTGMTKTFNDHTILMSLEHLIVVQEQSHVLKMSTAI